MLKKGLFCLLLMFFVGVLLISAGFAETYGLVTTWGSYGDENGQFAGPDGISVSSTSLVYVVDRGNGRVQVFDSNGRYLRQWGTTGRENGQFSNPSGIAINPLGVYVCDNNNLRVQRFTLDGEFVTKFFEGERPSNIAANNSGDVYVTSSNSVRKFRANGIFDMAWGRSGVGHGEFRGAAGVAIDSGGNVYVADYSNHRIQKFNRNGVFITSWGSRGNKPTQFQHPVGIAIDAEDKIYVADYTNRRIQKFYASGKYITSFNTSGFTPTSVAIGGDGSCYVTVEPPHSILKFRKVE